MFKNIINRVKNWFFPNREKDKEIAFLKSEVEKLNQEIKTLNQDALEQAQTITQLREHLKNQIHLTEAKNKEIEKLTNALRDASFMDYKSDAIRLQHRVDDLIFLCADYMKKLNQYNDVWIVKAYMKWMDFKHCVRQRFNYLIYR